MAAVPSHPHTKKGHAPLEKGRPRQHDLWHDRILAVLVVLAILALVAVVIRLASFGSSAATGDYHDYGMIP